ncbi:MAG: MFS transporter [Gemmatimonadaceae bacterium]
MDRAGDYSSRHRRTLTRRGPSIARALSSRNYRLFFSGQTVSLVGTWITRIATSWLVYRLTGSAFLLGLVSFCSQIPTLVLTPFSGVLIDRWNRHTVLLVTQVLSMLQSLALAILAFSGRITVTQVLILQLAQGCINAFDTPARQAFVVEMVEDRSYLSNAIALNSTMVNASRIIGPSIGGMIIALAGEGWCFMVDAISYIAVIVSLLAMNVPRLERAPSTTDVLEELRAGLRYIKGSLPIRTALILLAIVSTMSMPYTVLMPAIATQTLHGGAHTLGFLMTASGVGALVGALYLASRLSVVGLEDVSAAATVCFGLGLIGFALSHVLWLSLAILPIVGAGFMVQMASINTIIQTLVDERLRGRVMAFYVMAFLGTAPIGSLLAGIVAARIGSEYTILFGGSASVAAGIWFASKLPKLRAAMHPIYVTRGVITAPSVADMDDGAESIIP